MPDQHTAYKAPVFDHGVRGSIQRARQDQADAADLKAAEAKYGKDLPNVLAKLEAADRALHTNPALASARIAAAHGAPATESQIAPYQAKMAEKRAAKAHQQRFDVVVQHIVAETKARRIPTDEKTREEMAAIIQHPRFQHNPHNVPDTLRRAAAIATHPDHVWLTGKRANKGGSSDAGSKSISGSPGHAATGVQRYGTSGVRGAVDRAMGR
jgi:hypothetical protein